MMLHKLLLALFVTMLLPGDNNLIDWSESRRLTWNDFTGRPDPLSPDAALTSNSIHADFGYDTRGLKHSITCQFDKTKSWVKIKNAYILNHEQGHFDLAESYARELHKELLDYQFDSRTVDKDLNRIYSKVLGELVRAQQQYDSESNHSLDTAKQREWDAKIKMRLKEFEQYKDYRQRLK